MDKQQQTSAVVVLPTRALPLANNGADEEEVTSISRIDFPDEVDDTALAPLYVLRKSSNPVMIVEIVRFTSQYGSWLFVPEDRDEVPDVCSNGNITIVTAVDPLFCTLVLMDARRAVGEKQVFQPLDSLCITADGTDLSHFCDSAQLGMVCDVKEAAGSNFYKLNDVKTLAWLVAKHEALAKHPNVKPKDAVEIMSQYLTPKWRKRLRKEVLADVDNVDTAAYNSAKTAQNLALALMLEDAKETNKAMAEEEHERKHNNGIMPKKKKSAAKSKKVQKAPQSSWWANREKALAEKGMKKGLKRTRSASSTK